jgi:hypothetical protein
LHIYWSHKECIILQNHLQFIILQLIIDIIKVENDAGIQSEEEPIGMVTEEVHIPSPFCVQEAEPKVSHISLLVFMSLCLCLFLCLQEE